MYWVLRFMLNFNPEIRRQLDYVYVMAENHLDRVRKVLGRSGVEIMILKAVAGLSGYIPPKKNVTW